MRIAHAQQIKRSFIVGPAIMYLNIFQLVYAHAQKIKLSFIVGPVITNQYLIVFQVTSTHAQQKSYFVGPGTWYLTVFQVTFAIIH